MAKLEMDTDYSVVTKRVVKVAKNRLMDLSDELIFHYCSADTLLTVLERKNLRFSDARFMNDGEEVVWATRQLERALQRLRDREGISETIPSLPKKFIHSFLDVWHAISERRRHFLACFSLTGDSLSQWRAYADDAQGFAMGFRVDALDVPANFVKVEYDVAKQQDEIIRFLVALYENNKRDTAYFERQAFTDVDFMHSFFCAYKNPAFLDEREVRGIHMVGFSTDETGRRAFKFIGGHAGGQRIDVGQIEYRVSKARLIPYVDMIFQLRNECALQEVWMGPRCATPLEDFEIFLRTLGYDGVQIKMAGSKYR